MAKRATAQEERRAKGAGEPKIGGDEEPDGKKGPKRDPKTEGHLFFPKKKTGRGKNRTGGNIRYILFKYNLRIAWPGAAWSPSGIHKENPSVRDIV